MTKYIRFQMMDVDKLYFMAIEYCNEYIVAVCLWNIEKRINSQAIRMAYQLD